MCCRPWPSHAVALGDDSNTGVMAHDPTSAPRAENAVPGGGKTGTSLSNVFSSTNTSLATISFQPRSNATTTAPTIKARLAEAPVFVPRSATGTPTPTPAQAAGLPATAATTTHPAASSSTPGSSAMPTQAVGGGSAAPASHAAMYTENPGAYGSYVSSYDPYASYEPRVEEVAVRHPLQYHLCAPPFPHVSNFHPTHLAAMTFFMDPELHEELHRKQEALYATAPPTSMSEAGNTRTLPESLHVYHNLVALEPGETSMPSSLLHHRFHAQSTKHLTGAAGDPSRVFGYPTHVYKATCALDGKCYVLRRLEGFHPQQTAAMSAAERWRKIRHPSLVAVREAFTTRAFGDHSVVFVYDYHPLATTLYMEHMTVKPLQPDRRTGRLQPVSMHVPERVLWSYACQLAGLLRVVHKAGLAVRCLEPSKVLRTAQHRVRLNGCAIFDVLFYQPQTPPDALVAQQQDDIQALGRLLLSTGCNNVAAAQGEEAITASLETFQQRYGAKLTAFLKQLLSSESHTHINDVLTELAPYLADEQSSTLNHADMLEASLMRELENGRLVRLLCKLNALQESDHTNTESGERYVIRLFRDMVFHAVDEHGRPAMDLSHVLVHLNKLDAGVDEKMMLTSRDELNCVLVSYADVKKYVEAAYAELVRP